MFQLIMINRNSFLVVPLGGVRQLETKGLIIESNTLAKKGVQICSLLITKHVSNGQLLYILVMFKIVTSLFR